MSKLNPSIKKKGASVDKSARLAGGYGPYVAKQPAEQLLRRAVLSCLLWEDMAYESGASNAESIASLIPKVDPLMVASLAHEARIHQKLRHVPLYIACEMLKHDEHRKQVANLLPQIITRPDQITDFLALYWKEGKKPLRAQAKKGLAESFHNFNEYQFSKYDRDGAIKLRDAYFLVHPTAKDQAEYALFDKIAKRTLDVPDTWEVALSAGKDKKATWERLIEEGKLGALAFLRNLRNMKDASVDQKIIRKGFASVRSQMLLPLNFWGAVKHAPEFVSDIDTLMLRTYSGVAKLPGYTKFVVDVSGSMGSRISAKSDFTRMEAGISQAVLAHELCEEIDIYLTAGSDGARKHRTEKLKYPKRGFQLADQIRMEIPKMGGGGIFTRQCLEAMKAEGGKKPDRIIILSDSQDCDLAASKLPAPFGTSNYIVDVSANKHGINYKGVWTAEISGWSEQFLNYIAALEGVNNGVEEE
jgi:60 kDa SS-A/Ro ribonucleoprotein